MCLGHLGHEVSGSIPIVWNFSNFFFELFCLFNISWFSLLHKFYFNYVKLTWMRMHIFLTSKCSLIPYVILIMWRVEVESLFKRARRGVCPTAHPCTNVPSKGITWCVHVGSLVWHAHLRSKFICLMLMIITTLVVLYHEHLHFEFICRINNYDLRSLVSLT